MASLIKQRCPICQEWSLGLYAGVSCNDCYYLALQYKKQEVLAAGIDWPLTNAWTRRALAEMPRVPLAPDITEMIS